MLICLTWRSEPRRDLTHLPAFAIDDEENQDPDDAVSLDGERLWVHVADVAALVAPDSEADLEARGRGANLYLPERIVNMLPLASHGTSRVGSTRGVAGTVRGIRAERGWGAGGRRDRHQLGTGADGSRTTKRTGA